MTTTLSPEGRAAAHGLARPTDPDTSRDAVRALGDLRASQREVLQLFVRYGSMDDHGLIACARHAGVNQSPSGLRTRRSELVASGWIIDTGHRTGEGRFKRTVWAAVRGAF